MSTGTWHAWRLSNWTKLGGVALDDLGPLGANSEIVEDLSAEATSRLELDASVYALCDTPIIVRVDLEPGVFREFRLDERTRDLLAQTFTVTAYPPIYELEGADLVREVVDGETRTSFDITDTPANILARLFVPNLAADGVGQFAIGTVEFTTPVTLQVRRWTRATLLQQLQAVLSTAELQIRPGGDGTQYVDLLQDIGGDVPELPVRFSDRLLQLEEREDWSALATVARIHGAAPTEDSEAASLAENLWVVVSRRAVTGGRHAVELREIQQNGTAGARGPVLADNQYAAPTPRYLQYESGTERRAILASRRAAQEVDVADPPPAIGERVTIVADADGNPLELLELPDAITRYGRRRAADFEVPNGRGERQYARNGGHENGLTEWAAVNTTDAALRDGILRTDFGVSHVWAANGPRAAGVGAGTPLAMDGGIAGRRVYRGDQIEVGGGILDVDADAIPNSTGQLTLSVATPGLPGNFANGHPITLHRREIRTLTLDGEHSIYSPFLLFQDAATEGFGPMGAAGLVASANGASVTPTALQYAEFTDRFAGKLRLLHGMVLVPYTGWSQLVLTPSSVSNLGGGAARVFLSAGQLALLSTNHRIRLWGGFTVAGPGGPAGSFTTWPFRVTALTSTYADCTVDTGGLVAGDGVTVTFLSGVNPVLAPVLASEDVAAHGTSFTVTHTRESRVLLLAGSHVSGATTLNTQAVAAIARRDWLNGDSVFVRRPLAASAVITAVTVVDVTDPDTSEFITKELELTLDTGASTIDDVDPADRDGKARLTLVGAFGIGGAATSSSEWIVESVAGGVAYCREASNQQVTLALVDPQTAPAAWVVIDTLAVTAGSSWNATGLATVTAAVPAGRSYPKGTRLWTNWHASGATGAAADAPTNLELAALASGPAASISVRGTDQYTSLWNGVSTERVGLYRVFAAGSEIPIPGNTLYAAAPAVANSSGQISVTLTAANANAIADNAPITITRPPLIRAGSRTAGLAMRLFHAVGGVTGEPNPSTPMMAHTLGWFRVPSGATRTITVRSLFALSQGTWTPGGGGPVVSIHDLSGAVLAWAALAEDVVIDADPGEVTLVCQATISAPGLYGIRVTGGSSSDFTKWCVHLESFFYRGDATDAPYAPGSHASTMQLAAGPAFLEAAAPRYTDRLTVEEITAAWASAVGIPADVAATVFPRLTLGMRLLIEERGRRVRVTRLIRRPAQPPEAQVGALALDGGRLIGDAMLAAGAAPAVRGIR